MDAEYLQRLRSSNPTERMQAWRELPNQPGLGGYRMSTEDRRILARIIQGERDLDIKLFALTQMIQYSEKTAGARSKQISGATRTPDSLDEWFSSHFAKSSVVLGVRDKTTARRDELALVHLARRFSIESFPHTAFEVVPLEDSSWQQLIEDHNYVGILAVGRMALFGEPAMKHLSCDDLRFSFPSIERPPIKGGELNEDYHQVIERDPETGNVLDRLKTVEQDGFRTDYGLVQLYPVVYCGRHPTTVGVCAGCSSLGTQGAARWLAYDLGERYNVMDKGKIGLPPHANKDSRFEVLLRVTANLESDYRPISIEVCRMYLGDWQWSADTNSWSSSRTNTVVVIKNDSQAEDVLFNGVSLRFQQGKQTLKLVAFIFETMAAAKTRKVKLADIRDNREIWDSKRPRLDAVKRRLHTLKPKFEGALQIQGEYVQFEGNVRIETATSPQNP